MSFIHHAIAKKMKEDKEKDKMDLEESPVKTVLGSLARNSLASDTLSLYTTTNSANHRRRRKNQWRPLSIEDVPFRRQDRMTLNVKNRIESDKKLVFFIVGLGIAFIVVGLFLLLLYKLYHEDIKEVKPVIFIGPCMLAAGGTNNNDRLHLLDILVV